MHRSKNTFQTIKVVVLALFALSSFTASSQDKTHSGVVVKSQAFDFVIRVDTVHKYNEYAEDTMHYFNIHAVEIYRAGAKTYQKSDPKFLQSFPLKVEQLELWRYDEIPVRFLDVNFDGYKDFEILFFAGMYWNNYQYFIYNPARKEFIKDPYLVELSDPTFHDEKEYVHYDWHVGVNEFGHAVYQWHNDELKLLGREIVSFSGIPCDQWSCFREKRVNGKMEEKDCLKFTEEDQNQGLGPCDMHTNGKKECDLYENSIE